MPTLHLLMGLPGSGKSTLAKRLQEATGAVKLSSDELRLVFFPKPTFSQAEHDVLYQILDNTTEQLLKAGLDVIYDANLNRRIHRTEKYDLANKYSAKTVLWWLSTPADLSKQRRLDAQNHILIPNGDTPENLFDRVARVLEEPTADELCLTVDGTTVMDIDITGKLATLKL